MEFLKELLSEYDAFAATTGIVLVVDMCVLLIKDYGCLPRIKMAEVYKRYKCSTL